MSTFSARAWQWLGRELDAWVIEGHAARFWWRDDDATEPSSALSKLAGLSDSLNIPLALAVIPSLLKPELIDFLRNRALISVLQHGYAHENHAAPGQRKLELGGTRATVKLIADLKQGYQTLEQHFADRFDPVLVPPWNRIAYPAPGLLQVNTHLDPVNWRHTGGFIGVYPAIAILIQHLIAKRTGYRDRDEPTGILTHHLVQNDAVWRFLEDLLQFLSNHPAVGWLDSTTIWK